MPDTNQNDPINGTSGPAEGASKPTVVGVGASAGGLAALKTFFEHVPPDSGLTFVVVVHLSPEHKSHLADLLQPSVRFPVQQVTETTLLEPDRVYVIPPNANLSAIDTHLRLSKLEEQRRERAPIDHFFRTLASTHDGHAVGIVLTGTGSDGTLGIKDIKARGGLVIVQDPNEAEYDGMPQSAIATGLVDRILQVADIPEAIIRYDRTQPKIPLAGEPDEAQRTEKILLPKFFAVLRARTDRDFSRYKRSTILRRIARRMQLSYTEDLDVYLEKLREQPEEARALADDLLITVTSFFRDPEVFGKLEKETIPHIFDQKRPQDSIRVWSVGCATGEEAYSLAILLKEEAARREVSPQIQVFASDLHKRSLDSAREGIYPGDIATDVGTARLSRYFTKENGGYRIQKEIRDLVVFAPHNLLADPPFSRLDIVSCRNLLIYLERDVQRDVIELFHYALCPEGFLVLGSAETLDAADLFRPEDKRLCLYRKRNVPAPEPRLPVFPLARRRLATDPPHRGEALVEPVAYGTLHQRLLDHYAPPSILVNPDNKVVHLSDNAGRYLVHPGGEPTLSVQKLVREELRMELRSLLQTARERRAGIDSRPIPVQFNGHANPVVMHVRPAWDADQEGFALVIFDEREPEQLEPRALTEESTDEQSGPEAERIRLLETELVNARQRLQAIIEEYETSQEEMKAASEEMQSTNEELRSTMEELETVNQENRHKVEELSQLSSDLHNLLSATDIATLFLDRDLRILRFTPKLGELFNVRVTDRGRPISDLTHRLGYGELRNDASQVLSKLIPIERTVQDDTGRWYLTRLLPYRSAEDRIEGVVITFIDISSQKKAEAALRASEERFRRALGIETVCVSFFGPGGQITWANDAFLRASGYSADDLASGRLNWDLLTPPEWLPTSRRATEEFLSTGSIGPYEREILKKDGSRWVGFFAASKLNENEGVEFIIDITDRKRAEEALRIREREFNAIANLVPDLIWKSEPDGQTYWYSQRWYDYTGQTIQQAAGFGWTDALHPQDQDLSRTRYLEAIKTGRPVRQEHRIRGTDGTYRWFLFQASPSHDQSGRIVAWFGTATDIHKERLALEAVAKSLAEKEALLKEVHHRVKNNLQVITSLLNLQARQSASEDVTSALEVARNRVQSIAWIHEMLYSSESLAAVDLAPYARRLAPGVVRLYGVEDRVQVEVVGNNIALEIQRAVPFGLLLNELVSNACKHAFPDSKKGKLKVGLKRADSRIVLTVSDNGVGLPPGFSFERTKSVGMNLIRNIATQLAARTSFRSDVGTSVEVEFPAEVPPETVQ